MTFEYQESFSMHKSMHLPRKRGRPPKNKTTECCIPKKKTMMPKEEEEADGGAENQRARYNIPCTVDNCDSTFSCIELLSGHKKYIQMPHLATVLSTLDKKTLLPKKEEGEVRAEDQSALRAQMSSPQRHSSESQLTPKKEAFQWWTKEEEEEELNGRAEYQRALRAQTSSQQGCAPESQQPRYNIPCSVDYCDLTFSSMEALRVHKKEMHRTPDEKTIVPKEEEEENGIAADQRASCTQTLCTPYKKTTVPKEEEEEEQEIDYIAEDQRALRAQTSWTPDNNTIVPKEQ
ncbi:hypothetical protein NHX12_023920 [Muraenolepis orangiensis]|uniref:C2H2-type domain-containing protein n=1 Tax=Muraenolepis orangiensis TaxID=630683 RepID=A0A9Q0EKI3_9TELE|nr:hypothetical protein NHX12_023920 [Muraenolepis orangiensis]